MHKSKLATDGSSRIPHAGVTRMRCSSTHIIIIIIIIIINNNNNNNNIIIIIMMMMMMVYLHIIALVNELQYAYKM